MRIVVAGASGFVGRQLVPILTAAGAELLLAGRDPAKLSIVFPGIATCGYDDLAKRAHSFDTLINLAVLNSDSDADMAAFRLANVDFVQELYRISDRAAIGRFYDISSVHALDPKNQHPYACSKREGSAALSAMSGPPVTTLYLPALYHRIWSGKMSVLNRIPGPIARALFSVFAAVKPTLDIAGLARTILAGTAQGSLILTDGQDRNPIFKFVKRALDLIVAVTIVIGFSWLLFAIWAAIRMTSAGPGIFAQVRVGRGGNNFTCYKFRTMKTGTAQAGTHEISTSAVTRIGAFLRRTKLDELPQVLNILRNEVSLVGPRPCLPSQAELVDARRRAGVYELKPGITGLAQVNGIDMSDPNRLAEWDGRYARLQCLALDLSILLATAGGGGSGDNLKREG